MAYRTLKKKGIKPSNDYSVGKCLKTGKLQFDNERDARKSAKQFRKKLGAKIYPYVCWHCDKWHNGHPIKNWVSK